MNRITVENYLKSMSRAAESNLISSYLGTESTASCPCTSADLTMGKLREVKERLEMRFAAVAPTKEFRLIESPHACVRKQIRFPRTRKKRILKKWAKREENYAFNPGAYLSIEQGIIIVHPAICGALRGTTEKEGLCRTIG